MGHFRGDLRIALRSLGKARGFAVAVVATLVLAIALATVVLAVVNAYLIRALPYPGASRLYGVSYARPGEAPPRGLAELPWDAVSDVIAQPISWDLDMFYLVGGDHPDAAPGAWVTPGSASDGPGRGSEFSLRLPCLLQELDGYRAGGEEGEAEIPDCAPLRILVVDDSRDAAESLSRLLRLGGHEVLIAHEGERALHLAATQQPAVVLLDIGLPGMDGYEICRRLRQGGLANSLIVAMTGYELERDWRRSQQAGFDTHLVKPVPPEDLLRMMALHSIARKGSAGQPTKYVDAARSACPKRNPRSKLPALIADS